MSTKAAADPVVAERAWVEWTRMCVGTRRSIMGGTERLAAEFVRALRVSPLHPANIPRPLRFKDVRWGPPGQADPEISPVTAR